MENFSPLTATIGGVLIGLSAGLLWVANGRIAGISSIFGGIVPVRGGDSAWRIVFLVGLPIGAILGTAIGPLLFSNLTSAPPVLALGSVGALAAGALVGIGTRLGGGCTSGHGICGLARFSTRSTAAVGIFMAVAIATVFVTRHVLP